MPSMPGIRMSISTTSGAASRHSCTPLGAVGGRAHDGEVRLGVEHVRRTPARIDLVVVDDDDPHRRRRLAVITITSALAGSAASTHEPATGRRPGPQPAAHGGRPLPHAQQSVARRARLPRRAGPVVADPHAQRRRPRSAARRRRRRPARAAGRWSGPPGRCGTRRARRRGRGRPASRHDEPGARRPTPPRASSSSSLSCAQARLRPAVGLRGVGRPRAARRAAAASR